MKKRNCQTSENCPPLKSHRRRNLQEKSMRTKKTRMGQMMNPTIMVLRDIGDAVMVEGDPQYLHEKILMMIMTKILTEEGADHPWY